MKLLRKCGQSLYLRAHQSSFTKTILIYVDNHYSRTSTPTIQHPDIQQSVSLKTNVPLFSVLPKSNWSEWCQYADGLPLYFYTKNYRVTHHSSHSITDGNTARPLTSNPVAQLGLPTRAQHGWDRPTTLPLALRRCLHAEPLYSCHGRETPFAAGTRTNQNFNQKHKLYTHERVTGNHMKCW